MSVVKMFKNGDLLVRHGRGHNMKMAIYTRCDSEGKYKHVRTDEDWKRWNKKMNDFEKEKQEV